MGVLSTTLDYSAHPLKDINICGSLDPFLLAAQKPSFTFSAGVSKISSYIAGIQKLVQRYIIALTTKAGSQPSFPAFGTSFLGNIQSKNMVTYEDAIHEFNFANMTVIENFRKYQADVTDLPLDEQLNTAILESLRFDRASNSAFFDVRIYSNAGANVIYLLPIPISKIT